MPRGISAYVQTLRRHPDTPALQSIPRTPTLRSGVLPIRNRQNRFTIEDESYTANASRFRLGNSFWGENIVNHGYGVYILDKDDYQFVNLHNPSPYLSFKINSYEDIKNNNEILTNN